MIWMLWGFALDGQPLIMNVPAEWVDERKEANPAAIFFEAELVTE